MAVIFIEKGDNHPWMYLKVYIDVGKKLKTWNYQNVANLKHQNDRHSSLNIMTK